MLKNMDAQLSLLVLVRGTVQGRPYWAYARIPPSRYPAFQEAQAAGGYNLADYASEVPAQGYGEDPPAEIAKAMADQGFDPGFDQEFQRVLEEAAGVLKGPESE
jgi:hypothetical protein